VDRKARALGISRNRLIVRALERELTEARAWSEAFLTALRTPDPDVIEAAETFSEVVRRRKSRRPPRL
jgi:hypothetical protein